jgi:transposase
VQAVSEQITVTQNQLHALIQGMYRVKEIEKMLEQQISVLQKQKQDMLQRLEQIIDEDTVLKDKFEKILKIKGLSTLSLATIVAETDGFALTQNITQLTSYAGYDVVESQSGNTKGKTKISKKGNGHIRRVLHFPSLNVVRYQQGNFHLLYERIYKKSGIKMKGYVAVQRKLLALIYTLWKRSTAFDDTYATTTSGNDEPAMPSFASALQKPDKKIASDQTEATQDKLPSKNRRKPSFA